MHVAEPMPGEQCHFHRTNKLSTPQMRAVWIEGRRPPSQLVESKAGEGGLESAATRVVERWLFEQIVEQRAQVEARTPDDQRCATSDARLVDPRLRLFPPTRRRVALGRLH